PVAPDAANVDGMIRGRGVQVRSSRPAALGQARERIQVEGRRAHGHGDDPLAPRPTCGQPPDHRLDVGDGSAAREGRVDELEPLAVEMSVRVDEARDDGGPAQIDDASPPAPETTDAGRAARRGDAPADDGQGRDDRPSRIEGEIAFEAYA